MGTYAVTGGSSGIGAKTVNLLKQNGHEVLNIDLRGGDITADLSTPDGRQHVIDELHRLCPDGLDGLVCNAGVSGACVVTSSNTISQGAARMDIADLLNNNNEDEQRILNVIGTLDESDLSVGNSIYVASKYALARWVRRHSASYAANGVRINAVAPGNVNTTMTATLAIENKDFTALGNLFTDDGHYCDYCPNGTSQHEYHLYGKEAISMFFRNKFLFRQYAIMESHILNDEQAEFIASFGGYCIMALVHLQSVSEDGHIVRLTVRPR